MRILKDISRYFEHIPSMTVEDVRRLMSDKSPQEYNLVDVRQPEEYERGHIPGARLISVGEIGERFRELDPDKPTIAY
jgi:rhodanese-related sulfurtransferase